MTIKIKMIKTINPSTIPNGSVGLAGNDIEETGLHYAVFAVDKGIAEAYVFAHEVETITDEPGANPAKSGQPPITL